MNSDYGKQRKLSGYTYETYGANGNPREFEEYEAENLNGIDPLINGANDDGICGQVRTSGTIYEERGPAPEQGNQPED
jgi:hypothetical protein